jgi:LAS superfamily LD-carboxypeptidase LdcB
MGHQLTKKATGKKSKSKKLPVFQKLIQLIPFIVNIAAVVIIILLTAGFVVGNNSGLQESFLGTVQSPATNYASSNDTQSIPESTKASIEQKLQNTTQNNSQQSIQPSSSTANVQIPVFSGDQFKQIYKNQQYPNTKPSDTVADVTGYPIVDEYIRNLALKRGFVKQQLADESKLTEINSLKIQPQAAAAFNKIQELAAKDNIKITLVSAYRSPIEQKVIFAPIMPLTYYEEDLVAGGLDYTLNQGMDTIAPPGFSRHHTGYAMDFGCDSAEVVKFRETPCYEWLKKDNFKVLIQNNLIPSYPEGTTNQGPAPEEWEFVWVEKLVL